MPKPKNAFTPRPGQVDYTDIRWAPVLNCVVRYRGKILVLQRSTKVNFYPGYWNGISGFLDDQKDLLYKVKEELREEAGIPATKIISIKLGEIFDQDDKKHKKIWIVHPVLVEVSTDKVTCDWESHIHRWMTRTELKKLKLLPGFDLVLEKVLDSRAKLTTLK